MVQAITYVADTAPKLLIQQYNKWGSGRVSMRKKHRGIWREYTWKDEYENVKCIALGLASLGLEPGDKICVIAGSHPESYWLIYATQAIGGCPTGWYRDSSPDEIKEIVLDSDSKFVVAEDQEQVDKVLEVKHELPRLTRIIYLNPKGMTNYDEPTLLSFDQVIELGGEYEESHPGCFEENVTKGTGALEAILLYTSGSTGERPKGVPLTHQSWLSQWQGLVRRMPLREDDNFFPLLDPFSVAEALTSLVGHVYSGSVLNFAEKSSTQTRDVREIAPNVVVMPFEYWRNIASQIRVKFANSAFFVRLLYDLLLPKVRRMSDSRLYERRSGFLWRTRYAFCYLVLCRALLDKFGLTHGKHFINTVGLLSKDTLMFLSNFGLKIKQLYCLAECGCIAAHSDDKTDYESVGSPIFGVEVRVSDDGECLVRRESLFSGYYKSVEHTREVLKSGWFHTGDAGFIDGKGCLVLLGKLQDLRELANKMKYAPEYIEGELKSSPYIKDAVVIGGKERDYISAVIIIDFHNVANWARKHFIRHTSFTDLTQNSQVDDLVAKEVQAANKTLPVLLNVKKYVLLPKELDVGIELNRSGRLDRTAFEKRYSDLINAIYQDREEAEVRIAVKYLGGEIGPAKVNLKTRPIEERGNKRKG
jgi:long-chain acyl-CoA synthetase